jgi:hypothetical protein
VIVEIFVSESQSVDPLGNQLLNGVLATQRAPVIFEACGETPHHACGFGGLAKKQSTGITGDQAGVEIRFDATATKGLE